MHKYPEIQQSWPKPQTWLSWFLCSWKSKGELRDLFFLPLLQGTRESECASVQLTSDSLKTRMGSQAPSSATGPSAAVYQMPVHNSAASWTNDLLTQRSRYRAASALHGWGTWAVPWALQVQDVAVWGTYLPQSSRSHVSF